ncbi:MAG: MBOAT family protein, partial [Clostridia bacterium]|nr:MBOAT family protein [Clostridia bacterium]
MVFSSLVFLFIFLPLNLLLYFVSKNKIYRNIVLTVFSLIFYAWGEPVWIVLLIFSASIDYVNGRIIEKNRGNSKAKLALVISIAANLSLLVIFKYSGFFFENINSLLGTSITVREFSLPIGISFYTFQTLSYTIDVYRGHIKAQQSYHKFLLFVSLFHQLVAG